MSMIYFDTREYIEQPTTDTYSPVPAGDYEIMITEVKEMQSKEGKAYVTLVSEIVKGEYRGRKIFDNLYITSENPKAVNIAKRKLNDIAKALDLVVIKEEGDIKYKMLTVNLYIDKDQKNQVREYKKHSSDLFTSFVNQNEQSTEESTPF